MKRAAMILILFAQQDEFDRLVERLGADEVEARQKAAKDLVDLGQSVLPRIRERLNRTDDAEVRAQLKGVILELERLDRVGRYRPNLRPLTIQGPPRGFRDTVEAAASAAAVPLDLKVDLPGTTALTFDRVPFWEALEKLRHEREGFRFDFEGDGDDLRLIIGKHSDREYPRVSAGPFLLEIRSANVTRWLFKGTEPGWTSLDLRTHRLPGGQPLEATMRIKSVKDDLGTEYVGGLKDADELYLSSTSRLLQLPSVVPGKAKELSLRGEVVTTHPKDVRGLRIENPAGVLPKEAAAGEYKVTMTDLRESSSGISLYFWIDIRGVKPDQAMARSDDLMFVLVRKDGRRQGFNGYHKEVKSDRLWLKLTTTGVRAKDVAAFEAVELIDREEKVYPFVFERIPLD
ncbi:MAG: hypothetical protein HY293_02025 [Planctomycetes bacterium]|nr:hypothetical protein [Planctomycetota bacterium]